MPLLKNILVEKFDVWDVTLLTVEEVRGLSKKFLMSDNDWWLRSGSQSGFVSFVYSDGSAISVTSPNQNLGVRPVIKASNLGSLGLSVGETFKISDDFHGSEYYLVISDDMIITENFVFCCVFNNDISKGNDYETSYIKSLVESWSEDYGFAKAKQSTYELCDICDRYFENSWMFDYARKVFAGCVVKQYEESGKNSIYNRLLTFISSDNDFDIDLAKEDFDAINACYDKYKNVSLPKRKDLVDCEDCMENIMFYNDFQEGLGE